MSAGFSNGAVGGLPGADAQHRVSSVQREATDRQSFPTTIAFLGPAGTFTEEALLAEADLAQAEVVPMPTIADVLDAAHRGEVEAGFVPIENSIEGTVSETVDHLIFSSDLLILREVVLDIHLHLLAPPGVETSSIRRVLSYPHASAQCREYLQRTLPGAVVVPTNSTAEAARVVGDERSGDSAALAPILAARLYDLAPLASSVEDHPGNQTRFLLVGRETIPAATGHDKTSIVCFQGRDRPGSLHQILGQFAARSINLTKIESRPTKAALGSYCFLIDFEGHLDDEIVGDCLRELHMELSEVRLLGSYPAAGAEGDAVRREIEIARREADEWLDGVRGLVVPPPGPDY
jgi:prephenate dehydratase